MPDNSRPDPDLAGWSAERWADVAPDLNQQAIELVHRFGDTARSLLAAQNRSLRAWRRYGVTGLEDYRILSLLYHLHNGLRMQEIADRLDVEPGTVSSRVNRLQKGDMVEKIEDPLDGRSSRVRMKENAKPVVDEMAIELYRGHRRFFSPLSRDERATLTALLAKL